MGSSMKIGASTYRPVLFRCFLGIVQSFNMDDVVEWVESFVHPKVNVPILVIKFCLSRSFRHVQLGKVGAFLLQPPNGLPNAESGVLPHI